MKSVCRAAVLCCVLSFATAGILMGPKNTWTYRQSSTPVVLRCEGSITSASDGTTIQWWEYGTDPAGAMISDQNVILPSHPNRLRYALNTTNPRQYDLFILSPELADGTTYQCRDSADGSPNNFRASAELIVIDADPACKTTMPGSIILEGSAHTADCIVYYNSTPGVNLRMTWTGPDPFIPSYNAGNNSAYSQISFTAARTMDTQSYTCRTYFDPADFNIPDSDNSAPNYEFLWRTPQLLINWGPKDTRYEPIQLTYNVGQTMVGFTDAFPAPTFKWQVIGGPAGAREWNSQSFQIDAGLIGNNSYRLHAENMINGLLYYEDVFAALVVNPIPTTPIPGPSTTTTEAPARANCGDLTGKWTSQNPPAIMCINVDFTTNGVISGQFKNGTNTYFDGIYGRVQLNTFDQGGFTLISDDPAIGVYAFVLECQACFGVETLIVSPINNAASLISPCGSTGVSRVDSDIYFTRESTKPQCA